MQLNSYKKFSLAYGAFGFASTLVIAILSLHLRRFGYSDVDLGIIFSLFPLGIMFTMPIIGFISDRFGKRVVLLTALLFQVIAITLYLFPYNIYLIYLARFMESITVATFMLIGLAKAEDSIKEERGRKSGWFLSIGYAGRWIAPPIATGIAAASFTEVPILLSILVTLLIFVFLYKKKEHHFKKIYAHDLKPWKHIKRYWSFRQLRGMAILGIVHHAGMPTFLIFLPLYIVEFLGQPIEYVGYAYFAYGFTHILQMHFGVWSDRYGHWRMILTGSMGVGICWLLVTLLPQYLWLVVILIIFGSFGALWNVSAWHLMSEIGEKYRCEGVIVSSYASLAKIGSFLMAIAAGFIIASTSFNVLAYVNGVLILLGWFAAYFYLKPQADPQ